MTSNYRPKYQGWALILTGAAVLALGGCGRKGGLDLPPSASSQPAAAVQSDPAADQASKPSVFNPSFGADAPGISTDPTTRSACRTVSRMVYKFEARVTIWLEKMSSR